jgi:voltage-gated potassium channel
VSRSTGVGLVTRRESRPERTLLNRLLLVGSLLLASTLVFALFRAGLRDQIDGHVSTLDVIYFAVVAMSTTGFGDIVPVSDGMRLFTSFVLTPIRLVVWFVLLGTAYEFVVQRLLERYRMSRLEKSLRDHLIVCGAGDRGTTALKEMLNRGAVPSQVVVVDPDAAAVHRAADLGCIGLVGDASSEERLRAAGIERARCAIVCTGRDDTNLLIVLTIRHLCATVRVVANAYEPENVKLMAQAGASSVLRPGEVNGFLLAEAASYQHVADTVLELLDRRGSMHLTERTPAPHEIGRRVADLAPALCLRVFRGGERIDYWRAGELTLQAGDLLHVIEPA